MEMMKIADHKRFSANGHEFLFVTHTGSIFELEKGSGIKPFLDHGISRRDFSREDLDRILKGEDGRSTNAWEMLSESGLLSPHPVPGQGKGRVPSPPTGYRDMPVNTLVLHVTESCNLMCRYCYHEPGRPQPRAARSMDRLTARAAVDFLFEQSGSLRDLVLVFFGGEPLLNFKLISGTVAYANEKAMQCGKRIDYAVTTNGTLLTDRHIGFLLEHRFGTTISMDGQEPVHDRFRRFPDGSPSYRAILPGLEKLLGKRDRKPVVARVTLARDVGDLSASLFHLLDLGFSEVGFAPVTTGEKPFQLTRSGMADLLDQFREMAAVFVRRALEDRFLGFTNLVDLLVNLHEGEVRTYPCGAGLGMFSVAPRGGLFLCQRLTQEASARMGDVFTGFDREKVAGFRRNAGLANKSDCKGCWAASICSGGCYHEAMVRQGDLLSPNLHYCSWIKAWVETGLSVYGRLAKQAPGFLDKLSLLRGHAPLSNRLV